MRKEVTLVVVTILVIASLTIGYLAGNSARSTETITSTSTSVGTSILTSRQTVTSVATAVSTVITPFVAGAAATAIGSNGNSGVDLILALNATALKVGQSLDVDVSLFNARPSVGVVLNSTDWPWGRYGYINASGIPIIFGSRCSGDPFVDAVVLQGNYTLGELPSAANSTLTWMCPEGAMFEHMTFEPESSVANVTETYSPPTNVTLAPSSMSISFTTDGYWNLTTIVSYDSPIICFTCTTNLPVATPYVPGVYTVAVSDEWGQVALLHVAVQG
jgi:hypothetical protein